MHLNLSSRHRRSDERTVGAGRRNDGGLDCSELAAADVRNRVSEVRLVEHVISIRTQTQTHMLGERDILQDAEVRVEIVGTTEVIPWNVAEVDFVSKGRKLRGLQTLSRTRSRPRCQAARGRASQE